MIHEPDKSRSQKCAIVFMHLLLYLLLHPSSSPLLGLLQYLLSYNPLIALNYGNVLLFVQFLKNSYEYLLLYLTLYCRFCTLWIPIEFSNTKPKRIRVHSHKYLCWHTPLIITTTYFTIWPHMLMDGECSSCHKLDWQLKWQHNNNNSITIHNVIVIHPDRSYYCWYLDDGVGS